MRHNLCFFIVFLGLCLLFQLTFSLGQAYQLSRENERFIANIETRVALDLSRLKIANEKFRTAADPDSIKNYLKKINRVLLQLNSSVRIVSLQSIQSDEQTPDQIKIQKTLKSPEQDLSIELQVAPMNWLSSLSLLAPLLALFVTALHFVILRLKPKVENTNVVANIPQSSEPKLFINLKDKTIRFGNSSDAVLLSNKPFCFYAALVDYCLQTDLPNLKHNNEVPAELLLIANKYFYRLIELGHTKRKRPDFGANLDKTLSEIRSALDEVFKNNIELKEPFYPPKAQGEGSRSKMHNYAIVNSNEKLVEFIGK